MNAVEDRAGGRPQLWLAVGAVLATLIAAVVGVAIDNAAQATGDTVERAHAISLTASGQAQSEVADAQAHFDRYRTAQQARRRAADARARTVFAPAGREEAAAEYERFTAAADAFDAETERVAEVLGAPLTVDGEFGPFDDPSFPLRFLLRAGGASSRSNIERLQQDELANELTSRQAGFGLALAMLAIAVFFFGFALTPHGADNRGLFGTAGVVFLLAASAYAVWLAVDRPEAPPSEAAEAFALANELGAVDQEAAFAAVNRSIELWPDNPGAYNVRARLRRCIAIGPECQGPLPIEPPPGALDDLFKARELGLIDPVAAADIGYYLWLEGLRDPSSGRLEEALGWTQDLAEEEPCFGCPVGANQLLPLVLIATQSDGVEEALDAYARGFVFADPEGTVPSNNAFFAPQFIGGVIQDLEILLLQLGPDFAGDVLAAKQRLVSYVMGEGQPITPTGAEISNLELTIGSGDLGYTVQTEDLQLGRDSIAQYWYEMDETGAWELLGEVSGRPTFFTPPGPDGRLTNTDSYLVNSNLGGCLGAGPYRLELYLNGELAQSAEAPGPGEVGVGRVVRFSAGGVRAGVCAPSEWELSSLREPGLAHGFRDSTGGEGAVIVRVQRPVTERDATADAGITTADEAIAGFAAELPAQPWTPIDPASPGPFAAYAERAIRAFEYTSDAGPGIAFVASAIDFEDGFVIAIVFGPREREAELRAVFESTSTTLCGCET